MSYSVGQKVIYKTLHNKREEATIVARKVDFDNGVIKTWNAQGNFDYLVEVVKSGVTEQHFCEEEDLD